MEEKRPAYSRREFMSFLGMSFVSLPCFLRLTPSLLGHQRKDPASPRSASLSGILSEKSRVVIVEGKEVYKMIRKGLEALDLPEDFFKDKATVIKPNTHWSEEYPSTSDPASLLPVIDFLRERKSGNITIVDGSGKDLPHYRSAFEFIGFEKILATKGVNIDPLDIWRLGDFVTVKRSEWNVFEVMTVHSIIHSAPVLISMTCLKRHGSPQLTAALKNNIGAICARSRYRFHFYTRGKVREAVAEIADAVRPDITIIDARDILVKDGPGFLPDKSNLKRGINKVLLSTDMVALDTVAAQLMVANDETFEFETFRPTLDHGQRLKLGNTRHDLIDEVTIHI